MKEFMTELYCYEYEPDNIESESYDEIHIDIKYNAVVVESDSAVLFKKQRRKQTLVVYSTVDSEEEKSKIKEEKRKRTTFVKSDNDVIPSSEPKSKRIICYEDSESDTELDNDIGLNINVENNITDK